MPSIFQNFVAFASQQIRNLNTTSTDAAMQSYRGPYLMQTGLDAGLQDGLYKAVIPAFLYKPPFGYPLSKDIPEIRRLSKTAHVSMIINTICDEIAGLDWKIVPKKGEQIDDSVINETQGFFYNPNSNDESFDFLIRKLVRDILEIDAGVIVKVRNMKGDFLEWYVHDGATFTKNCNIHGILPEEMAYFQYGWATGARPTPFNRNEIVYIMKNPRADSIYGRSNVENLFDVLRLLTYGVESNLEYYTDNNVPRGVFQMAGASSQDVQAFQNNWMEMLRRKDAGGNYKKYFQKMPVVNTEGEFVRIGFSNLELEMLEQQKWFSRLAFACFGVTPDELGFTEDSNKAVSLGQSAVFKRKAIRPLVQLLEYHFNTQLVNDLPWIKEKYENKVLFEFDKFDLQEELQRRQLIWGDIAAGYRGVNEIRKENNLEVLAEGTTLEANGVDEVEEEENTLSAKEPESNKEQDAEEKKDEKKVEEKALTSESPVDPKAFEKINKTLDVIDLQYKELEQELLLELDKARRGNSVVEQKAIAKELIEGIVNALNLWKVRDVIAGALKEHFFDGNDKVEEKLDRNILPNSDALEFLKKHTFSNIKGLEDDSKNKLRQELERALINDIPQEELAGKIRDVLDVSKGRAKTIANTEIMRAKNLGEMNAWKECGVKVKKKVIAVIDSKTSEVCRHLNNKKADLNENFTYDGQEFSAPPFHPNCRSVLGYSFEGGK